jgi:hypothetical protein
MPNRAQLTQPSATGNWSTTPWNTNQLDWQEQCPPGTKGCPDVGWFWILALGLGAVLIAKHSGGRG